MEEAIRSFKRIYPEAEGVQIVKFELGKSIIKAALPGDGTFYFIVTKDSVSASYDTLEQASNRLAKTV